MAAPKDDEVVVKFMTLFYKLRDMIDDDPTDLEALAADDKPIKRLCLDLSSSATFLSMNERRRRQLFAAPVDPKFITAWRDYEERYASPVSRIDLADFLGLDLVGSPAERKSPLDARWDIADGDAKEQAKAITAALDFAEDQASDEGRWIGQPDFAEHIQEGTAAWKRLTEETGFDLRGVFRRRELVPFVLIPRHVSRHHGEAEKLSLLTNLQQAQAAFVFGVPFAALALMRSILETVLKTHYHAEGENLAERINNCRSLPAGAPRAALHRLRNLANEALHFNKEQVRLPKDLESETLSLLYVLRALIESAPMWRSR